MLDNNKVMTTAEEEKLHQQKRQQQENLAAIAAAERAQQTAGSYNALETVAKFSTVAGLSQLQALKDSNGYVGIPYQDSDGNWKATQNWEEYCVYKLGESRRTIDDRLLNLKALGESFFEGMQRIGLGPRFLNQIRRLPEGQQKVVENTLKDGVSKDEVKTLIADLTEENEKEKRLLKVEKEQVEKELESTQTDLEIQRQLSAEKQQQLDELKENKFRLQPWQNEAKDAATAIMEAHAQIMEGVQAFYSIGQQLVEGDVIDNRAQGPLSHILLNIVNETMQQAAAVYRDSCQEFPAIANAPKTTLGALEELGFDLIEHKG